MIGDGRVFYNGSGFQKKYPDHMEVVTNTAMAYPSFFMSAKTCFT